MQTQRNVLFVPHGAPTFALQPGAAGAAMTKLAQSLKAPRAIVVVSPHWETAVATVGTATQLETIYDFGGFDPRLYELRYPATGCPAAAQQVVAALQAQGCPVQQDAHRGLDHGAWIPLRQMFPEADIRVTRDLVRAGQLLKIEILDHVIVGSTFTSLRSLGYFQL